jgi:hypothetical protein
MNLYFLKFQEMGIERTTILANGILIERDDDTIEQLDSQGVYFEYNETKIFLYYREQSYQVGNWSEESALVDLEKLKLTEEQETKLQSLIPNTEIKLILFYTER